MDRIRAWTGKLFWNVVGNALYAWLAGGALVAGVAVVLSWLRTLPPVWFDRGITALIVLAVVMVGSAIQARMLRKRRSSKSKFDDFHVFARTLHELEGRPVPGGTITNIYAKNVTITNQTVAAQEKTTDYEATVDIRVVRKLTLRAAYEVAKPPALIAHATVTIPPGSATKPEGEKS